MTRITAAKLSQQPGTGAGETSIAPWKDNKEAAFCLMFDDSAPSAVTTVVPELKKRNLVGTFYVNPGSGSWRQHARAWEKEFPSSPLIVYANHTMTHKGARSVEALRSELQQCNSVLEKLVPGPKPRLISFGRPGVNKEDWTVTEAELASELKRLHLIERPPFGDHGAMVGPSTPEQMVKLADTALAQRGLGYIVFHGVGGDWIVTPTDVFVRFLDLLEGRRSRLWITDPISAHIYRAEREQARVRLLHADARQIRLDVTAKVDPALYPLPLTFLTRVPADWKQCEIVQKQSRTTVKPEAGPEKYSMVKYSADPHGGPLTLLRSGG